MASIHINAAYVVMRAHHSQEYGLLQGKGYDIKEQTRKQRGATPSVSSLPLKITARRGDKEGTAVLNIERDPGAALYEVQFCIGAPAGEDAWQPLGSYKKVRIFLDHLQRAVGITLGSGAMATMTWAPGACRHRRITIREKT